MSEYSIESICDQLVRRYDRLFGPVFHSVIQDALSSGETLIAAFRGAHPEITCDSGAILFSLGDSLFRSSFSLCSRSFVSLLLEKKALLIGQTPEERYRYFVQNFLLPTRSALSPESELGRLASHRISRTLAAVEELLSRLGEDLTVIRDRLGLTIRSLDNLTLHAGDTHNGGRFVILLTVNGGEQLVYKPRSLETDEILRKLMEWLNKRGTFRCPITHLPQVSRDNYGWQSFAAYRACANQEEAERYMYRVGVLLLITYLSGSTDLHFENLVASGDSPVLIDTETLFGNSTFFNAPADSWNQCLLRSVFTSGLLPIDVLPGRVFERRRESGLLAGLTPAEASSPMTQIIIRAGTDEMCFSEVPLSPQKGKHTNLAQLDGQPLHPGDFIELIAAGFRDAYEAVLRHKEALLEAVRKGALAKGKFRQLFRDTAFYQKILLASYHPSYAHSSASRRMVFEKLHGRKAPLCPEQTQLVREEIAQLLRDDVPYFYTSAESHAILAEDGCVIEHFYKKTIRELLEEKLERFEEADLFRQLFFIRTALEKNRSEKPRLCFFPLEGELRSAESEQGTAEAVLNWIIEYRDRFHRVVPEGDDPLYLIRAPGKAKTVICPERASLYYGIGSFLFYDQYERAFDRRPERSAGMLRALTNPQSPLLSRFYEDLSSRVGLFEGRGAYLYLYLYLYRVTGNPRFLALADRLCDDLIRLSPEDDAAWDVINGYAGVVIFALNAWKKQPTLTKLKELAEVYGKKLYEGYSAGKIPFQTGFGHGYAGYSAALIMLGTAVGNEAYYSAGLACMRRESELYDPAISGWRTSDGHRDGMTAWCYGASGILVARELARPYTRAEDLPLLDRDRSLALQCTVQAVRGGESRPVLCHGLPGNLSILRWYAGHSGDTAVLAHVNYGASRLLQILRENGVRYCNNAYVLDVSFMDGLTGLGYYLLSTFRPALPDVLALEVL